MRYVLVAFVVVPLVELYLLLWLGSLIGFWPTVAITVITGVLGGSLAKREGLRVWRDWQSALAELRPPASGVIEGVLVLIGGAMLITPGVLTDLTGLVLLLPPTRRRIAARIRRAVDQRIADGRVRVVESGLIDFGGDPFSPGPRPGNVVDTTGAAVDDEAAAPRLPTSRDD